MGEIVETPTAKSYTYPPRALPYKYVAAHARGPIQKKPRQANGARETGQEKMILPMAHNDDMVLHKGPTHNHGRPAGESVSADDLALVCICANTTVYVQ